MRHTAGTDFRLVAVPYGNGERCDHEGGQPSRRGTSASSGTVPQVDPGGAPAGGAPAPIETDPAIVTELIARTQASIAALKRDTRPKSGSALFDFILVDRGVEDVLDEGFSPPEQWSSAERFGNTREEQREGESFEERLRQEVPEEQPVFGADPESPLSVPVEDDILDDGEVGDERAGRLVHLDQGVGPDEEQELVGDEVGIDGAGASAEEAAVHIVDDDSA